MSGLSMFIPLTKVDAEKRLVYGVATAESKDRSGEVMDYATSKPLYEKWSGDIHTASGGLSKGNLRAMHGKTAAGKLTEIHFNDASKQVEICAKVVDDGEWQKVVEGVYTGFSQGGSYAKRWTDPDGTKRYTAAPNEVSLVDLPCLASATFDLVKADGVVEQHRFADAVTVQPPTIAVVAAKAADLAKAAGKEDFAAYLDTARDELTKAALPAPPLAPAPTEPDPASPEPPVEPVVKTAADLGIEQVWKAPDGQTFGKKADALTHATKAAAEATAKADAGPALDALAGLTKALAPDGTPRARLVKAEGEDALAKNLRHVSRLADMVSGLSDLHDSIQDEAAREADGSAVPGNIKDSIKSLSENLKSMCGEEVDELMARKDDPAKAGTGRSYYDDMYMAAGMLPEGHVDALVKLAAGRPALSVPARDTLAKIGARNSAKDATKIQAMHDQACDLGASCKDVNKVAGADDLQKRADTLTTERDEALAKHAALKGIVDGLAPQIADLKKMIEAQPVPAHLVGRAVSKVQDAGGTDPANGMSPDELAKALEAMSPEERALVMTKVSLGQPHRLISAPN